MGEQIGHAVRSYMDIIYDEELNREERRKKMKELKANKNKKKK